MHRHNYSRNRQALAALVTTASANWNLKVTALKPYIYIRHRCNRKGCQSYINPHHLHPIFVDGRGSSHIPLQTQSALLFLLLNRVSHPAIHCILALNHKAIEDMGKRLNHLRKGWVEEKERSIVFGNGRDGQMWRQMRPLSPTPT